MDLRSITAADVDACVEVFYAADEELTARLNLPLMPRNRQALHRMFVHVSASTPERAWLAEESGHVVGFGMAVERGGLVFLSFLFVLPGHQRHGIGRALYERCMSRAGYRATCIWSIQPVSASVYARDGLVPLTPIYTFTGRPRSHLPRLDSGLELTAIDQLEIDALDAEVVGLTRRVDHVAWQGWDRLPFALRGELGLLGYGYVQPAGRVGPVVVRRPENLLPLIGSLMDQVAPKGDWMIHVPGMAAAPFQALLTAGLRFDGAPTIFCATEDRIDHSRYLPGSFALP